MATANYIGGDVLEFTVSNPDLGDFRFQAKSGEAFNLDKGGFRTNDEANSVTGGGKAIYIMNNTRWSLDGNAAVDMLSGNEMDNLPALAASLKESIITFTHISGYISKGTGKPVGDLVADSDKASMKVKFAGSGQLEKISN